jgi:hypothetical protein
MGGKEVSGLRSMSQEEAGTTDAILTGFAAAVGADQVAPMLAVSLIPVQSTVTLSTGSSGQLNLQSDFVKLAFTIVKTKHGDISINTLAIDDSGNVKISGLSTGERIQIVMRVVKITIDRADIAKAVVHEVKQKNIAPERVSALAKSRVEKIYGDGSSKVDEEDMAPLRSVASANSSQLSSTTQFQLSGIASNAVQSASHPVIVTAEDAVLGAATSVQCDWAWDQSGSSSEALESCSFINDNGRLLVSLPASMEQQKSGMGQIRVRLANSSGGVSGTKIANLYITPSVAGLSPCTTPAIVGSPESLLASPSLATTNGQEFDNLNMSTNVRISVNLADHTKVIDKYSLRTSFKKIRFRDSDYLVIYKAWPAFTAQHYQAAISHSEMCRIAQEYKPKVNGRYVRSGNMLTRFDAMVVSAAGTLVGVDGSGQARRIANAHQKDLTKIIGAGAEKQVSENCDSPLPSSKPARAAVFCVKILQ